LSIADEPFATGAAAHDEALVFSILPPGRRFGPPGESESGVPEWVGDPDALDGGAVLKVFT